MTDAWRRAAAMVRAEAAWTVANHDTYAVLHRPDGSAAARFHVIAEAYMACRAINEDLEKEAGK